MAFPRLYQKLFQNDGAGEKLNPGVVPTTVNGVAADASGNITIKDENIANGPFLPTAGGTLNGVLKLQAEVLGRTGADYKTNPMGVVIRNSDNKRYIMIAGGIRGDAGDTAGSALYLSGSQHGEEDGAVAAIPAGAFLLSAAKTAAQGRHVFIGHPNGDLFWDNAPVLSLKASGMASNHNWWYRKYSDGWIEQGGYSVGGYYTSPATLTFPMAFTSERFTIVGVGYMDTFMHHAVDIYFGRRTKTSVSAATAFNGLSDAAYEFMWFACGY